jgi:hypothetical protein
VRDGIAKSDSETPKLAYRSTTLNGSRRIDWFAVVSFITGLVAPAVLVALFESDIGKPNPESHFSESLVRIFGAIGVLSIVSVVGIICAVISIRQRGPKISNILSLLLNVVVPVMGVRATFV